MAAGAKRERTAKSLKSVYTASLSSRDATMRDILDSDRYSVDPSLKSVRLGRLSITPFQKVLSCRFLARRSNRRKDFEKDAEKRYAYTVFDYDLREQIQ